METLGGATLWVTDGVPTSVPVGTVTTDDAGIAVLPRYTAVDWKLHRRMARRELRGSNFCGTRTTFDPEVMDLLVWRADLGASVHPVADVVRLEAPVVHPEGASPDGCRVIRVHTAPSEGRVVVRHEHDASTTYPVDGLVLNHAGLYCAGEDGTVQFTSLTLLDEALRDRAENR